MRVRFLTCCLIFTVVDFLSDGAQSNRPLDDVVVVRHLHTGRQTGERRTERHRRVVSVTTVYLSPGHQLHKGPAVFVSDQLHHQLLASRQLVDAVVPPRGAAARGGRGGLWED